MTGTRIHRLAIVALALLALSPALAFATPNVSVQHTVQADGVAWAVIQDDKDPMQWYYIPSTARVAENSKGDPEFTLLKYQSVDPNDKEKMLEGGFILFSVTLAPNEKAQGAIASAICALDIMKGKGATPANIRIAGVPMEDAKMRLFDYGNEFIASAAASEGIGSSVSATKIPFAVKLTKLGSKTFEELTRQSTGFKVDIDYTFTAITPKLGCKVTFDWSKIQTAVSSQTKVKSTSGDQRYWSHGYYCRYCYPNNNRSQYSADVQSFYEQLKTENSITVEKIVDKTGKTDWDEAKSDLLIAPVLERIKEKLLKLDTIEFDKVEPVKASDVAQPDGYWGYSNENRSVSEKKVDKSMLVKETFSYNVQYLISVPSSAGGFIGLGAYPKNVQDQHIVNVGTTGDFQHAVFSLPPVSDKLEIQKVSYTIAVKRPDGTLNDSTTAEWLPPAKGEVRAAGDMGWRDPQKNQRKLLLFALKSYYDEAKQTGKAITDYKFETKIIIQGQVGKATIEKEKTVVRDMFDGDVPVSSPFAAFNAIQIDGDMLTFDVEDEFSTLKFVSAKLSYPEAGKSKPKSETFTFKPGKDGSLPVNPWLTYVDKECDPIRLELTYNYGDLENPKKVKKVVETTVDLLQEVGATKNLVDYMDENGELVYFKY